MGDRRTLTPSRTIIITRKDGSKFFASGRGIRYFAHKWADAQIYKSGLTQHDLKCKVVKATLTIETKP